jgi:hypothetical protein
MLFHGKSVASVTPETRLAARHGVRRVCRLPDAVGGHMLFAVSWKGTPTVRNTSVERFLKTGGRPPVGVKMVGRWHDIGRMSGTAIAETDDPLLMSKWALEWNDIFEFEIRPVVTDEQAGPLLAQLGRS